MAKCSPMLIWGLTPFILAALVLGTVASIIYSNELRDEEFMRPTTCDVYDYTVVVSRCSYQSCTTGTTNSNKRCTTKYYTCYYYRIYIEYIATYNKMENVTTTAVGAKTESYSTAEREGEARLGIYPCWYDITKLENFRFDEPYPEKYAIMLAVGWGVGGGLIVVLGIIWAFLVFGMKYPKNCFCWTPNTTPESGYIQME